VVLLIFINLSITQDSSQELGFAAGSILFAVGEIDEDGFLPAADVNGGSGLAPANFLVAANAADAAAAQAAFASNANLPVINLDAYPVPTEAEDNLSAPAESPQAVAPATNITAMVDSDHVDEATAQPHTMVALYSYDPATSSPNEDYSAELSLTEGQVLLVFGEPDEDGYYMAEINGRRGLIPSNFVEEMVDGANFTARHASRHDDTVRGELFICIFWLIKILARDFLYCRSKKRRRSTRWGP
jgi:hypothetical protein